MFAIVYHAVHNRMEAEDLTQEAFLRALKALDRYQETGVPFRAFLATVARNLVRDGRRGRHVVHIPLDDVPEPAAPQDGPEQSAIAAAEIARLGQGMARLAPDYQTVLRLRLIDGRTAEEVATLMDRSPGAVRVLQHRALIALRAALQKGSPR